NNLAAGSYTIAVTDNNGCIFTAPAVTVGNTGGPTDVVVTPTDASCGASNGTVTVGAVTGGAAPYTYSINGSAFTTTTVYNNLAAGPYTIAVTDNNGCIFTAAPVSVNNTGGPTDVVVTPTDASCGASNGTVTIGAVTGGAAPYTYSINGSAFTTTTVYNNLAAGPYTIAVTDNNGCTFTAAAVTVNNTGGPTAVVVTPTDASCGASNGTVTVGAVTGGAAPYTYSINGSAFTTTTVYNNLAAGPYTIAVTDNNGCTFTAAAVTVNNTGGPTAVVVTPTDASCGASNGTVTVGAVTGGAAPYTYSINGSAFTTTTVYNNLAAGPYTIAVTDNNGCTFTAAAVTVNNTGGPTAVVVTPTDASCGASNGTVTVGAVTGGAAPYTYSINGSAFTTTTVYNNLAAGPYTIAVTDNNGCIFTAPAVSVNNTGGPTDVVVTPTDASCGASNGTVTVGAVTGGAAPYTYSINGSAFTTTTVYNNLAAGPYTIAVTDNNGCIFTAPAVNVNNTGGPTDVVVTPTDASCGASNGTVTIGAVTGGAAPYTYSINGSAFTTTTVYNNLAAGPYTIAVTDNNGCIFTAAPVSVNNTGGPTDVVVTPTDASCGASNGTVTIGAVTGGAAPYTYSINGSAFTTTTVYNNLAAGPYTIAVTDNNGCIFTAPAVSVNNTGGPTDVVVTPTDASCGASNGTVTVGAVTGGAAPYTYSINGSAFTTTTVYNNLAAGPYTIAVTDNNGCIFTAPAVSVNNTGGPTDVVVTPTDASCGASNGTVTVGAVTGGAAPYTYSINGSAFTTTTVYNNLAAGPYTIAVTDNNGCIFTAAPVSVNNTGGPTDVVVTPTDASCGASNGTVTIGAVTGGAAPYTYSINGSAFTTTTVYNNLAAGPYTIAVTDNNGCIFTAPAVTVGNTGGPTDVVVTPTDASCGASNGTVTVGAVTGGAAPYTYSINGSAFTTTTVYNNLAAGPYTIAVTDKNGCTFTAPAVNGNNTGGPAAVVVTPTDATCGNSNGTVTVGAVTGGAAPYTYSI